MVVNMEKINFIFCFIISYSTNRVISRTVYDVEYGNVFRQQIFLSTTQLEKPEYKKIIEWSTKYIEQRTPWNCPWLLDKQRNSPEVRNISKTNLIYTHNNKQPIHFDSYVYDKHGDQHGISSLVIFGSLLRFILYWKRNQLTFVHNFTVSVYPEDTYNIYMHTFYIQNVNLTSTNTQSKYLLPKFDKNSLKHSGTLKKIPNLDEYLEMNFAEISNQKYFYDYGHNYKEDRGHFCMDDLENCDTSKAEYRYSKFHQDHLTVMSYNIWNMNAFDKSPKGYTRRMTRLKQTILEANPDIIALQEVRYEEIKGENLGPNQMNTLANWLTDYQFVFQPAQMQPNSLQDGRTEEGVAIMSKYPIISHDYKLLFINRSNSADTHQRILLHVEIIVPVIGKVHVLNTHLSLSHEAREQSAIQICKYISQLEGPVILLGDMNAEPNEPAMNNCQPNNMAREQSVIQMCRYISQLEGPVILLGDMNAEPNEPAMNHEAREQSVIQICRYISQLEGPVILLGDMSAEPNEPAMNIFHYSDEVREQSVVQICRYISQLEGPVILLGDMNSEPNEPAMKYLSGQDLLPGVKKKCKLRDIWLESNMDDSGFTYNSLNKDLHKRIDYILYTGWHSCCKVETIKVIDDGKRGKHASSDHCPLMVTFSFHSTESNL